MKIELKNMFWIFFFQKKKMFVFFFFFLILQTKGMKKTKTNMSNKSTITKNNRTVEIKIVNSSISKSNTINKIPTNSSISVDSQSDDEKLRMNRHRHHHFPGENDEEEEKTICIGPNTIPIRGGKCQCKYGFIGNEETINTTGCWKCDPQCHGSAVCVANNTCECTGRLIGDGFTYCEPPVPKLISIGKPIYKDNILKEPVAFPVKVDADGFEPHSAFCKFGSVIAGALLSSSDEIICLTPIDVKGTLQLSVSYNGTAFSNSLEYSVVHGKIIPFELPKNEFQNELNQLKLHLTCVIILTIIYILYRRKHPRKERSSEEALIKKD